MEGWLLHSSPPKKRRHSSKNNYSAAVNIVGASFDAFFDHTGSEMSCELEPAAEEELESLPNEDAFLSVETMAVKVEEEASAPDAPRARTEGRRRVTAMETTCREANVLPHSDLRAEKAPPVRRCTHCSTQRTPEWRKGPEGSCTLCNACGVVFKKKGWLLPEYRPATSPAFSPLLHSNMQRRALKMHSQKMETTCRQANVLPHGDLRSEKAPPVRRCTHCATQRTPQWRAGPEGARTLCNACGVVFKKNGRLLPEYRPATSPAFSPLLYSNKQRRALKMHGQNETTSAACHGEGCSELPPANGPASSSTLQRCSLLRQSKESMEVQQPFAERPPADSPAFSVASHRRVLKCRRKSVEETFASICATSKDRRAKRATARLAALDD